jgi:hypothetical protein
MKRKQQLYDLVAGLQIRLEFRSISRSREASRLLVVLLPTSSDPRYPFV